MAKQATRGASDGPAKKPGLPPAAKICLFASAMPLFAVLFPSALVIAVGLTPTLVLYVLDRARERSFAVTVGLLNGCGLLPGLGDLWMRGHNTGNAQIVILDPLFWLCATAAAGIGWLIYMSMPPMIAVYYNMTSEARIKSLLQRRKMLIETWGDDIGDGDAEVNGAEANDAAVPD